LCSLVIIVGCTRPAECELPFETGPCRAMFLSFYFNSSTNRCEEFVYGGCGGNENRFKTEEECLARCKQDNEIIHEDG